MKKFRLNSSARSSLPWIGLAVSAVFAYLAVRNVRLADTWAALRSVDYPWLVPSLALLTVAFFIRVARWRSLFDPERRPPFSAVARALFVGYFFNNVLPARLGEAARTIALNRLARAPVAETAATVIIERAFDVLSLLVLLFVTVPWLPHVTWLRAAGWFALALTGCLVIATLVVLRYREQPLRFAFRPLARLPFVPQDSIERAPGDFLAGLSGIFRPRIGVVAFLWTTLSWLVAAAGFWLVMVAFDLGLSPLAGLLVVIGIGLSMILPSSPAAIGVFEGATVVVLTAYGIGDSRALSYALVLHALNLFPFLVLAIPLLGRRSRLRARAVLPEAQAPRA